MGSVEQAFRKAISSEGGEPAPLVQFLEDRGFSTSKILVQEVTFLEVSPDTFFGSVIFLHFLHFCSCTSVCAVSCVYFWVVSADLLMHVKALHSVSAKSFQSVVSSLLDTWCVWVISGRIRDHWRAASSPVGERGAQLNCLRCLSGFVDIFLSTVRLNMLLALEPYP